jgi:hypothetical protein
VLHPGALQQFYYITKLCRQQVDVIENDKNTDVRNTGHGETRLRKYKWLKVGGGQARCCPNGYCVVTAYLLYTAWIDTSTPQFIYIAWYLIKHGDNFTKLHAVMSQKTSIFIVCKGV